MAERPGLAATTTSALRRVSGSADWPHSALGYRAPAAFAAALPAGSATPRRREAPPETDELSFPHPTPKEVKSYESLGQ